MPKRGGIYRRSRKAIDRRLAEETPYRMPPDPELDAAEIELRILHSLCVDRVAGRSGEDLTTTAPTGILRYDAFSTAIRSGFMGVTRPESTRIRIHAWDGRSYIPTLDVEGDIVAILPKDLFRSDASQSSGGAS